MVLETREGRRESSREEKGLRDGGKRRRNDIKTDEENDIVKLDEKKLAKNKVIERR